MPAPITSIDEKLKPYATPHQARLIDAINKLGSIGKGAKSIGIKQPQAVRMIQSVRAKASERGYAPDHDMTHTVPETHIVSGVSTLYGGEGEVKAQWVKSSINDKELSLDVFRAALEGFKDEIPRARRIAASKRQGPTDLCNMFLITDYHLGMKSWHEETGDDWDLTIAERVLIAWFEKAIESAPNAEQAVFAQLGDFLHWDGLEAVTPTNKHVLDADTRYQKVTRVAIRVLRQITEMLLLKHARVHIVMADANHDPAGSAWLRETFYALYEKEPRVTVDTSPDTYYCFEWGQTSLFFHHGHRRKPTKLDDVLVAKFREVFGRTKFSYAHCGHLHHEHLIETNLMIVHQHRTLAARDQYASASGYMSGRDAKVLSYSKQFGEVGRIVISPEMAMAV